MSSLALSAPAFRRSTQRHDIFGDSGLSLFSVRAGVPVPEALNQASMLMTSAVEAAYRTADDVGSPTAFGTAYLVEMAKGAVDAAVGALHLQQREDTAPDPIAFLHEALEDSRQKAVQSRTAKMRAYHDGRASAFQIAIATLEG